jgi:hypothetical protein
LGDRPKTINVLSTELGSSMPDVSDVREIIPARARRVVSAPTPLRRPSGEPAAYFCNHRPRANRHNSALHSPIFHYTVSVFWFLSVSTRRSPVATFVCASEALGDPPAFLRVLEPSRFLTTVRRGCPENSPTGATLAHEGLPPRGGTGNQLRWPQRGCAAARTRVLSGNDAMVSSGPYDDSDERRSRTCRRLTAPPPTCDPRTSPDSSVSPPEPCADGAGTGRARPSFRRAVSSDIAAKKSTPGFAVRANFRTLRKCRRGGTPCQGRTAASVESAERVITSRSASHTVHPRSREVSVTPTLARRLPLRTGTPGLNLLTSPQISACLVAR